MDQLSITVLGTFGLGCAPQGSLGGTAGPGFSNDREEWSPPGGFRDIVGGVGLFISQICFCAGQAVVLVDSVSQSCLDPGRFWQTDVGWPVAHRSPPSRPVWGPGPGGQRPRLPRLFESEEDFVE